MAHPAPSFNHVAMSVPADLLDETGRRDITRFYREVFGFEELPTETIDRKRLVLSGGRIDQFVFLVANDEPMTCPRMDHWGMSVKTEAQLDDYLARAKRFREDDDRVDIVDKHTDDHRMLSITVVLRRVPAPDDGRGAVLGVQGRRGRRPGRELIRRWGSS